MHPLPGLVVQGDAWEAKAVAASRKAAAVVAAWGTSLLVALPQGAVGVRGLERKSLVLRQVTLSCSGISGTPGLVRR